MIHLLYWKFHVHEVYALEVSKRMIVGGTEFTDDWSETGMVGKRDEKTFRRSDESWEGKNLKLSYIHGGITPRCLSSGRGQ
jgi:hypothetical protein